MGLKYSKLSPRRAGELLTLFVAGATARTAADLVGVRRECSTVRAPRNALI